MDSAKRSSRVRFVAAAGAFALLGALVGACSSSGSISSCDSFNNANSGAQASAVRTMQQAHGDNSGVGLALLSVKAYCVLNPGGNMAGVYSG